MLQQRLALFWIPLSNRICQEIGQDPLVICRWWISTRCFMNRLWLIAKWFYKWENFYKSVQMYVVKKILILIAFLNSLIIGVVISKKRVFVNTWTSIYFCFDYFWSFDIKMLPLFLNYKNFSSFFYHHEQEGKKPFGTPCLCFILFCVSHCIHTSISCIITNAIHLTLKRSDLACINIQTIYNNSDQMTPLTYFPSSLKEVVSCGNK